jgi:hypothetical protein
VASQPPSQRIIYNAPPPPTKHQPEPIMVQVTPRHQQQLQEVSAQRLGLPAGMRPITQQDIEEIGMAMKKSESVEGVERMFNQNYGQA